MLIYQFNFNIKMLIFQVKLIINSPSIHLQIRQFKHIQESVYIYIVEVKIHLYDFFLTLYLQFQNHILVILNYYPRNNKHKHKVYMNHIK